MAKKRRRSHPRPHAAATTGGVRVAEPLSGGEDETANTNGSGSTATSRPTSARPAGPHRSRAEKKELARRQREEVRRQIRRAEMRRRFLWGAGAATVLAVAVFLIVRPDEPATPSDELPGMLTTEAPWAANGELALERADAIGLPAEGTTMHEHANVQVFVHGEQETVPQTIGIPVPGEPGAASLHTHTSDGLVHIESSQIRDFTLGEFFDVWGVRLTGSCVGAYCEQGQDELIVFRNGERVSGSIRDVILDDQTVVVLAFGTPDELPDPIPTFDFSSIVA